MVLVLGVRDVKQFH